MPTSLMLGVSLVSVRTVGRSYDPDAEALFARFTTPPTAARKAQINDLIVALKDGGVWSKLDALYVMAAADAQAARQNWIADQYNLTAVSSPTFTADRGYQGDGAASYLGTGLTPGSGQFALNSAHMAFWSRTDISNATVSLGARTASTTGQSLIQPNNGGSMSGRLNQDVIGTGVAVTSTQGLIAVNRSGASAKEYYRNGASLGTGNAVSTSMPTVPFFLLALNSGGSPANYDTRQQSAASFGAALTAQQHADFYTSLNTYMQAVGAA